MMEKFFAQKRKILIIFLLGFLSFSLPIGLLIIKEQTRSAPSAISSRSDRFLPKEKKSAPCPESRASCEENYDTLADANGCTYYRCKNEYPILINSGISLTDKSLVTLSLRPEKKFSRFLASNDSGFGNIATFSAVVNEADQLLGGPTGMIWAIGVSPDFWLLYQNTGSGKGIVWRYQDGVYRIVSEIGLSLILGREGITFGNGTWLLAGYGLNEKGEERAKLLKYDGWNFSDLSGRLIGFTGSEPSSSEINTVKYSAESGYFLLGGQRVVGGKTMPILLKTTDPLNANAYINLSGNLPAEAKSINSLGYNGAYWLIGGLDGVLLRWDGMGTAFSLLNPPTKGTIYHASWGGSYWLVSSGSNLLKATSALEFTDLTEKLTKANLTNPPRSLIFANNFWFLNPGGTLAIFDEEFIVDQSGVLSGFPGHGVNILGADEEKLLVAGPVSLTEKGLNVFTFNHGEKIPLDGFKKWSLSPGVGEKTVYVKFSDNKGEWSKVYNASIILVEAGRIFGIKEELPKGGEKNE